jgi:predicted phage tail protein
MGDASQFTNIPQRAYDLWGRIIQVPSNYDVTDRSYTGTWDGTFKPSWTNNPAWIFYDICTNTRYGLGHLVSAA